MIRLIYASEALDDWSSEQLFQLLKSCRKNNSANEITGILLYSNRTFFQVLEGDEQTVDKVYRTIADDPRHKNVTLIDRQAITERAFPYWSMGFEKIDSKQLHDIPGLDKFFEQDFKPEGFATHKIILQPILEHLRAQLVDQVMPSGHEELPLEHEDPFISGLHKLIRIGVKLLALLMTMVIFMGIIDVIYVIYQKLSSPPYFLLTLNDMLSTFGAFLAVLIAIEIFLNITLYIRSDVIPVKLVVATALMAICRKVIVFDYKNLPYEYVGATALAVLALGITYWLIQKKSEH